jgi:Xaa-Pro aminopeptidase
MMAGMDHRARRERLRRRIDDLGLDSMLISRLPNVRYLTGFTGSNGWLLLSRDGGDVLLTDPRYDEQSRREAPDLERRIAGGGFGEPFAETARGRVGFETAGLSHRAWRELAAVEGTELVPLDAEVERLRWAKDPEEIRLLERAQAVTDEAFERVIAKLTEGVTEQRVAFELEMAMREGGAERVGFDTIVAFGSAAAEPHHRPTDRTLRRGDAIKLDFGCVVEGYHSDMTRTVAFGQADQDLRDLHDLVLRAHLAGVEALRPGVPGGEVDAVARKVIEDAGHGGDFAHSLGHGVGLEIHEGPTLRRGSEDPVPLGAVVTVEPGVYLPGVGGVRIEDAVVVQDDGGRPLPGTTKELLIL